VTLPLTVVLEERWKLATNGATVQMQLEATQSSQKPFQFIRTVHTLKSVVFWVITRRRVVIFFTDVSGQLIGPILTGQESDAV
jgi:hypothetical protein